MKKEQLEAILGTGGRRQSRHQHLVPVLVDLYNAGCSIKQLEQLLGVSKKLIRTQLPRFKTFKGFRAVGPRERTTLPSADRVIGILRKHGMTLDDLPSPELGKRPSAKRGKRG